MSAAESALSDGMVVTVRADGYVKPVVRSNDCSASITASTSRTKAIVSKVPWRRIFDRFRRVLPGGKRGKFGLTNNFSARIQQLLDTGCSFLFWTVSLVVWPAAL
jgi:hypothetical protein